MTNAIIDKSGNTIAKIESTRFPTLYYIQRETSNGPANFGRYFSAHELQPLRLWASARVKPLWAEWKRDWSNPGQMNGAHILLTSLGFTLDVTGQTYRHPDNRAVAIFPSAPSFRWDAYDQNNTAWKGKQGRGLASLQKCFAKKQK